MMERETGGPAFPIWHETSVNASGLTIRDHFAGLAMQGWLASYGPSNSHPADSQYLEEFAQKAYATADAMLKARNPDYVPKVKNGAPELPGDPVEW